MTQINHDLSAKKRLPPTPSPEPSKQIFSSEKGLMDYISVKGIQQRTGVEKDNLILFILKELLDNSLDFLETNGL